MNSRLTDDEHFYPFKEIDLVGFHRRQQLALEHAQVTFEFGPENSKIALGRDFFTQRLIEAIGHGTSPRFGEARRF